MHIISIRRRGIHLTLHYWESEEEGEVIAHTDVRIHRDKRIPENVRLVIKEGIADIIQQTIQYAGHPAPLFQHPRALDEYIESALNQLIGKHPDDDLEY